MNMHCVIVSIKCEIHCAKLCYVVLHNVTQTQVIPNTGSRFEEVIESLRRADDRYQDASVRKIM